MDITLPTHDPEKQLSLLDASIAPDRMSFRTRMVVRSGGFSADRPFWIEPTCVADCVEQLRAMHATLTGRALLQPEHELDRVEFEVARTGQLLVSGELGYTADNYLKFSFTSDQTCILPLIDALEQLLGSAAPVS